MENIRSATIDFNGTPINIGIAHGLEMHASSLKIYGLANHSTMLSKSWPVRVVVSVVADNLSIMVILPY
jgi:hypothetical protein